MAQWVKRLLCKHEDLKLIPDNQKKMIQWLMLAVLVLGVRTRALTSSPQPSKP